MNRPASVTMNDGQPGADHDQAVDHAHQHRDREGQDNAEPQRPAPHGGRDRHHHAREADHRADREVELSADHQERRGHGDDAELGRDLQEGDDAQRREHAAAAGGEAEEDEDEDGPATAPSSGRAMSRLPSGVVLSRSSRAEAGIVPGAVVVVVAMGAPV
jgi:hypothetical protein